MQNNIGLPTLEAARQYMLDNGLIKTTFGRIKEEWIQYGIELGAITRTGVIHKDGTHEFHVRVIETTEIVSERTGRIIQETKKKRFDHRLVATWFDYLAMKRGYISSNKFEDNRLSRELL